MSLGWVIAGTFAQLMLAYVLFMLAAFTGGGLANGRSLSQAQIHMLDLSMLALPLSSVLSAAAVIYLYCVDAGSRSYWWYALPLACAAFYVWFASRVSSSRA